MKTLSLSNIFHFLVQLTPSKCNVMYIWRDSSLLSWLVRFTLKTKQHFKQQICTAARELLVLFVWHYQAPLENTELKICDRLHSEHYEDKVTESEGYSFLNMMSIVKLNGTAEKKKSNASVPVNNDLSSMSDSWNEMNRFSWF